MADTGGSETIDIGTVEVTRLDVRQYRKTALVRAGRAMRGGTIPTLEGDHSFEEGDYIAGPGAAGEFWPIKRAIFEATYGPADTGGSMSSEPQTEAGRLRAALEAIKDEWIDCECRGSHNIDYRRMARAVWVFEAEARSSHSDVSADLRAALTDWAARFLGGLSFNEPVLLAQGWAERRAPDIADSILADPAIRASLAAAPSKDDTLRGEATYLLDLTVRHSLTDLSDGNVRVEGATFDAVQRFLRALAITDPTPKETLVSPQTLTESRPDPRQALIEELAAALHHEGCIHDNAGGRFCWSRALGFVDRVGRLGVALSVADAEGTITPDEADVLERWAVR